MRPEVKVLGAVVAAGGVAWFILSRMGRSPDPDPAAPPPRLAPEFQEFQLIQKKSLTQGVACPVSLFRFKLPAGESLELPVGQHIALRCVNPATGKNHQRSYTPTSTNQDVGFFDLVVKVYPTGVLGQHLSNMHVGDHLLVKGPSGRFIYAPGEYDHICMLCGGSGFTPMYQIALEVRRLGDAGEDKTKVGMLVGNQTVEDIIMREELDALNQSPQIKVTHVVTAPTGEWDGERGFITKEHIADHCPPPGTPRVKVLICGPPPMLKAMSASLKEMGYLDEQVFKF